MSPAEASRKLERTVCNDSKCGSVDAGRRCSCATACTLDESAGSRGGAGRSEAISRRLERRSQVDDCRKNSIIVAMELGLKRNKETAGVATGVCVLVARLLSSSSSSSLSSWNGLPDFFWHEEMTRRRGVQWCSAPPRTTCTRIPGGKS